MKLFTINATPVRGERSEEENAPLVLGYEDVVSTILSAYDIDGFTIYKVHGYWKGEPELSFKIEVAHDNEVDIRILCTRLRDEYNQDAVMLTLPDNTVEFI